MTGIRRRAGAAGAVGAALLLTTGCGGQPTVVPAGSAGLEIPAAAAPAGAPAAPNSTQAKEPQAPVTRAPAKPAAKAPTTAVDPKAPAASTAKAAPAKARAAAAPKPAAKQSRTPGAKRAKFGTPTLPRTGTYSYAVTGTSSLGPPPAVSTLTVGDAGSGDQLWTLDQRREDGAGLVEELTLRREEAGVYLSAYRLDASTGIAGVILEFKPSRPVVLTPGTGKAGTTWPFDLGTSADGCASAKGVGVLLEPGDASSPRVFRLTTTVRTVGPASCVQLDGERVQKISHPRTSLLPTLIDSDLHGKVAGVAFKATTAATRSPSDDSAPSSRPALAADRVRL